MDAIKVQVVSLLYKDSSSQTRSSPASSRDKNTKFHVRLSYGNAFIWEIERSVFDFKNLSTDLKSNNPCSVVLEAAYVESDTDLRKEKAIEEFLSFAIDSIAANIWECDFLVRFLDVAQDQSIMSKIRIDVMSKKIKELEQKADNFQHEMENVNQKVSHLLKLFQSTSNTEVDKPPTSSTTLAPDEQKPSQDEVVKDNSSISHHPRGGLHRSPAKVYNKSIISQSPSSPFLLEISDDSAVNNIAPEIDAEYNSSDDEDSESSDYKAVNVQQSPLVVRHEGMMSPMRLPSSPMNSQYMTPPGCNSSGGPWDPTTESDVLSNSVCRKQSGSKLSFTMDKGSFMEPKSGLNSRFPSTEMLLVAVEKSTLFDQDIQYILQLVQPYDAQFQYRSSALGLLRKQIRSTLSVNTFDVSLHEIRCFLPDDPIKLSVIISKSHMATWHSSMVDHFTLLAERATLSGGNYSAIYPEDDATNIGFGGNVEEYRPLCGHIISNVAPVNNNNNLKLSFNIDSLEVDVCANNRNDICMLAFFEEFATLVGQDHLFKRSVLLIRAWWSYETASYVGALIKHYLSDMSQCIMICAIFNQYHTQIKSPFQALCYFLMEYSRYDGATQAITLQGLAPLATQGVNQVFLSYPPASQLVSPQLVFKYWQVFNTNQSGELQSFPVKNSSSSEDANNALYSALSNEFTNPSSGISNTSATDFSSAAKSPSQSFYLSSNSNGNLNTHNNAPNNANNNAQSTVANSSKSHATAVRFERTGFNIVHPFNYSNMINEKVSHRRVMKISKAFQIGAANLSVVIKQAVDSRSTPEKVTDSIRKYFPAVTSRFVDLWRPDAIGNAVKVAVVESLNDLLNYSTGRIWQSILYCNLIVESVVTESALINLSIEILADKGPLPVGEIGKILAELTSIPNLSVRLKEKFGGLKKFLERFPDKIFISNDHPFNPNVVLRSTLSAEHLELIDRGLFPMQLLIKSKKGASASKKLVKNGSFQHSRSDSIDIIQQTAGGAHEPAHNMLHTQSMTPSAYKKNISDMQQQQQQQQQPLTPGNSMKYPNNQQHSMALNHMNPPPAGSFSSPISSNNNNSNNGNYSGGKSQYHNPNSNPMYGMHSSTPTPANSWMSPMSQQQPKYSNMNNDYMAGKNVSQGGNNTGSNNLYVGSANANNKMLSSLRDGSLDVFAPGAVMNNDYDTNLMQTFYSPNRMSNSQAHRRSNTGGSFTGSDYGTEKTHNGEYLMPHQSPFHAGSFARPPAIKEPASLLSSLSNEMSTVGGDDFSGLGSTVGSRLPALSANTSGGSILSLEHGYGGGSDMPNVFGNMYHSSNNLSNTSFMPNSRTFGGSSPNRGTGTVGMMGVNESLLPQQQIQAQGQRSSSSLDNNGVSSTNGLNAGAPEFDFDRFVNSNRFGQY